MKSLLSNTVRYTIAIFIVVFGVCFTSFSQTTLNGTSWSSNYDNVVTVQGWQSVTTLTTNVSCAGLIIAHGAILELDGYTLTVNGNCSTTENSAIIRSTSGSAVLIVSGNITTNGNNSNQINLGANGTLKLAGNLQISSGVTLSVGTLELNGCNQTIYTDNAFTVSKWIQSSSCTTDYTKTGSQTITTTIYDQNCNSQDLRPTNGGGGGFSATASINSACGSAPPTLTAASSATVDDPFTITYTTDNTWKAAITDIKVKVNGTFFSLPLAAYDISVPGEITLKPSQHISLRSSGSKSIVVIATGYQDATVTQAIAGGTVTQLIMKTQPKSAASGLSISPQPEVFIKDQYGNLTSGTVVATVGSGSWTLGGTTSKAGVDGIVTYTDLTATGGEISDATITFSIGGISVTSDAFTIINVPTCGTGLTGTYHNNTTFSSPQGTRTDATINFNPWSGSVGSCNMTGENFSVRWTGYILPLYSETYTFYSLHDDNMKIIINGATLMDQTYSGTEQSSSTIALTAGTAYSIQLDYVEIGGGQNVTFSWSSASQTKEIVPTSQLFTELPACGPTLSATSLPNFGTICSGSTVGPNSFTITGSLLTTEDITVSALSGYTFSTTSGGPYTNSLTLTQSGGAYSQEIYVKFSPSGVQSYNGNIVVSGGGASSKNVAATGAMYSNSALLVSNVFDCIGNPIVFTADVASGVVWRIGAGAWSEPSVSTTIATGNFYASTTPIEYDFAVKDAAGNFCKNTTADAIGISATDLHVTTQPLASQTLCLNGSVTSLTVAGAACNGSTSGITYQWYSNTLASITGATLITGATSSSYSPSSTLLGTTYYYCVLTGPTNSVASNFSSVEVLNAPSKPAIADTSLANGAYYIVPIACELSTNGTSWTPYAKTNTIISYDNGGNGSGLYTYYARVSNAGGCYSPIDTFYVYSLYNVNYIPQSTTFSNTTVCRGTAVEWRVQGASQWGTAGLTYTWYKNTTSSNSGGTQVGSGATYSPSTTQAAGTYYYYCVIGCSGHSETYTVGAKTLQIIGPSDLNISHVSQCSTTDLIFTSSAGANDITYYKEASAGSYTATAAGATSINIGTHEAGSSYTYYFYSTADGCVSDTISANAITLTNATVGILSETNMTDIEICKGEALPTYSIQGKNCSDAPMTYEWFKNTSKSTSGATTTGITTQTFTPDNTVGTFYYFCVISSVGKTPATSTICEVVIHGYEFTATANKTNIYVGESVVLTAANLPTLSNGEEYGWYYNEALYSQNASLTVNPPVLGKNTYQYAIFGSGCNTIETIDVYVLYTNMPSNELTGCYGTAGPTLLSRLYSCGSDTTYAWYKNTVPSTVGGTFYNSNSKCNAETNELGDKYYYCKVYDGGIHVATSPIVKVTTVANPVAVAYINEASQKSVTMWDNESAMLISNNADMRSYKWSITNLSSSVVTSYASSDSTKVLSALSGGVNYSALLTVTDNNGCVSTNTDADATVSLTVNATTIRYYDGDGSTIQNVGNWTNSAGDVNTKSFDTPGYTWIIRSSCTIPNSSTWAVTGAGTKVVIGNGATTNTVTLNGSVGAVTVDVASGATLLVNTATSPTLGILATTSTVEYGGSVAQTISTANYGNLKISGADRNITLAPGIIYVRNQFTSTIDADDAAYISSAGNTVVFASIYDQTIPSFEFNSVATILGGTKTLGGDIIVNGVLHIGEITTLASSSNDIVLAGSGTVVDLLGTFSAGSGEVLYTNAANTIVAPLNYYDLNLGTGVRTLSNTNIIGIAGTLDPSTATVTNTGSVVEFNGSTSQTCPDFDFATLKINNASGVSLSAPITVTGSLQLERGILNTTATNVLTMSNPSGSASGSASSYINGPIKRVVQSGTETMFPVGASSIYYPVTLNPSGDATVTIQSVAASSGGTIDATLGSISSSEYWEIASTSAISANVSVNKSNSHSNNVLAYSSTLAGTYTNIGGSKVGNSEVVNASLPSTTTGYMVLGTLQCSNLTYYYNCAAGTGVHLLTSWGVNTNGTGAHPLGFDEDCATFKFTCNASVSNDWEVSGSNSNVIIGSGYTLTIADNVEVEVVNFKTEAGTTSGSHYTCATQDIVTETGLVISNGSSLKISGQSTFGNVSRIENRGTLSFYNNVYWKHIVVNNYATGLINLYNADLEIELNTGQLAPTQVYNYGYISGTNTNFLVHGTYGGGYHSYFVNKSGAVFNIDNSSSSGKTVNIGGNGASILMTDPANTIPLCSGDNFPIAYFAENSTFSVKNSDVDFDIMQYDQKNLWSEIGGSVIVEDGDVNIELSTGGGVRLQISMPLGGLYVYDTDNSGDGVLNFNCSTGAGIDIEGTVYCESFVVTGGNGTIDIKEGATMFIGDMGASIPGNYTFPFTINGTLNYCGNITALGDDVGTVTNSGTLNYAGNYYTSHDPIVEGDFTNNSGGEVQKLYESTDECLNSFYDGIEIKTSSGSLLPIQLTMLYGTCSDGIITLAWQTASEQNNVYFTLYRSFDGNNFEAIETIMGAGTSNTLLNYEYTDKVSRAQIVYYKLAQTDYDGTTVYSKIIAVSTCNTLAQFIIREYEIEVVFDNPTIRNQVIITTIDGKIVYCKSFIDQERVLISNEYSKGIYVISVISPTMITSEKFINLRK